MLVHKDFQGKGIATILLNDIERYAITAGITRVTSEVSFIYFEDILLAHRYDGSGGSSLRVVSTVRQLLSSL